MEITKEQAKLFLELLNIVQSIPEENNLIKSKLGNIKVGLFDTFVLTTKLKEFIGE